MLFEYASKTGRFMNLLSDLPMFLPVVASGMAVKMYADHHDKKHRFLQTKDLDITVFTDITNASELRRLIPVVHERFDSACEDYVDFLNRTTKSEHELVKTCPGGGPNASVCPVRTSRKQGQPFFDRTVYAFRKYYLKSGNKLSELMDLVVVYQAGITPDIINRRVRFGFPVPKVSYLIHELTSMIHVDILGQSPFNKKRHPVTGKESLKGVKDLHRLRFVLTLTRDRSFDKHRVLVKHLLNILNKRGYTDETRVERLRDVLLAWNAK